MNVPDLSSGEKVAAFVEAHAAHVDRARAYALARGRAAADVIVIFFVSDEPDRPSQIVAGHREAAMQMIAELVAKGRCAPDVAEVLIADLRREVPPSIGRVLVCGSSTTSVVDLLVAPEEMPTRGERAMRMSLGWLLLQDPANPRYAKRAAALARWQERAAAALVAEQQMSSPRDDLTVLWATFGTPEIRAAMDANDPEAALDLLLSGAEATPS